MGLQYLGGCIGGLEVAAVADRFLDVLAVGAGAAIAVVLQSAVLHIQVFGVHGNRCIWRIYTDGL